MEGSGDDQRKWWSGQVGMDKYIAELRSSFDPAAHYLVMVWPYRNQVWELKHGWSRVGRSSTADIRLVDPSVSRRHALIVIEAGKNARVLDDRSLSGVSVNDDLVEWVALEDGDRLEMGAYKFIYFAPTKARDPHASQEARGDPLSLGMVPASWQRAIGPMLAAPEVETRLPTEGSGGVVTASRTSMLLFAHDDSGRQLYPAFQFDADGHPYLAVDPCLREFLAAGLDPYTTAAWFVTAQRALEGLSPADWMRGGGTDAVLVEAARRSAALFRR